MGILPTGYGETLIYIILPRVLDMLPGNIGWHTLTWRCLLFTVGHRKKDYYEAPSMSVKRACDWSVTAPRRAVRVSEARMGLVNGRDAFPSRSRNSCPALQ